MPIFQRKPQQVELQQFDGTVSTALDIVRWLRSLGKPARYYADSNEVQTLKGTAQPGDYLDNEGTPHKPETVRDNFDQV